MYDCYTIWECFVQLLPFFLLFDVRWIHAECLFKALTEVAWGLESHHQRHLIDGDVRFRQQFEGLLQPDAAEEVIGRDAQHLLGLLV